MADEGAVGPRRFSLGQCVGADQQCADTLNDFARNVRGRERQLPGTASDLTKVVADWLDDMADRMQVLIFFC
ncbi:hypothetical protein EAH80_29315 [Mycobacterium hodleri]|uniref:Uncharacterized protein n=1 Tax=Mycolicibacterium hodleri TaxID=49897 RepID=A0A502DPL4_9MYCO|nr:hypothetical protein EAH80_29315 [Mycolicibacterium hodleri]